MKKKFVVYASSRQPTKAVQSTRRVDKRRIVAAQVWDNPNFDMMVDQYMPSKGEGDTMASQVATAINKLVYKWYNDGDVFDNTHGLEGFANDLSSYANWLYKYIPQSRDALDEIYDCKTEDAYEYLLSNLIQAVVDLEDLENWSMQPKQGSIYSCDGPFQFDDDPYGESEEDW